MVALNDLTQVKKHITVHDMPPAVKMAWLWQFNAHNKAFWNYSGVMGAGGWKEQAAESERICRDIYEARFAKWQSLQEGCTCGPLDVEACWYCKTPRHIREMYGAE